MLQQELRTDGQSSNEGSFSPSHHRPAGVKKDSKLCARLSAVVAKGAAAAAGAAPTKPTVRVMLRTGFGLVLAAV